MPHNSLRRLCNRYDLIMLVLCNANNQSSVSEINFRKLRVMYKAGEAPGLASKYVLVLNLFTRHQLALWLGP